MGATRRAYFTYRAQFFSETAGHVLSTRGSERTIQRRISTHGKMRVGVSHASKRPIEVAGRPHDTSRNGGFSLDGV